MPFTSDLISAVQNGNNREVAKLLKQLNLESINRVLYGNSALHLACFWDKNEAVDLLLDKEGIDVNVKDICDRTPLHSAYDGRNFRALSKLLAIPGIDVNARVKSGKTVLQKACENNHQKTVVALLDSPGIDVNAKTSDGSTVLHETIRGKCHDVVTKLLACPGIDVIARDDNGDSPVMIAARNRDEFLLRILLNDPRVKLDSKEKDALRKMPEMVAEDEVDGVEEGEDKKEEHDKSSRMAESDLNNLTVFELKKKLFLYGLPRSGLKKDLVARFTEKMKAVSSREEITKAGTSAEPLQKKVKTGGEVDWKLCLEDCRPGKDHNCANRRYGKPHHDMTKSCHEVERILNLWGVNPKNSSSCIKAAIMKGHINVKGERGDLDMVVYQAESVYCLHVIQAKLGDLLRQPDYFDHKDWWATATVVCTECGHGRAYVTGLCKGQASFCDGMGSNRRKVHHHCKKCPGFGSCIDDYSGHWRMSHCDSCGEHGTDDHQCHPDSFCFA